jgi:hypothetical protein
VDHQLGTPDYFQRSNYDELSKAHTSEHFRPIRNDRLAVLPHSSRPIHLRECSPTQKFVNVNIVHRSVTNTVIHFNIRLVLCL